MYGIKFLNCPLDNPLICIICSLFAIRMTSEDWTWDLSSSLTFQLKSLTSQCCSVPGKPALSLLGVWHSPINGLVVLHLLRAVLSSGSLLSGPALSHLWGILCFLLTYIPSPASFATPLSPTVSFHLSPCMSSFVVKSQPSVTLYSGLNLASIHQGPLHL